MKAFKEFVSGTAKVVGGIAGLVFLVAPVTKLGGWALMAMSAVVGLACFGAYMWAEPDDDPGNPVG